jgi:hypothetical protein
LDLAFDYLYGIICHEAGCCAFTEGLGCFELIVGQGEEPDNE